MDLHGISWRLWGGYGSAGSKNFLFPRKSSSATRSALGKKEHRRAADAGVHGVPENACSPRYATEAHGIPWNAMVATVIRSPMGGLGAPWLCMALWLSMAMALRRNQAGDRRDLIPGRLPLLNARRYYRSISPQGKRKARPIAEPGFQVRITVERNCRDSRLNQL